MHGAKLEHLLCCHSLLAPLSNLDLGHIMLLSRYAPVSVLSSVWGFLAHYTHPLIEFTDQSQLGRGAKYKTPDNRSLFFAKGNSVQMKLNVLQLDRDGIVIK